MITKIEMIAQTLLAILYEFRMRVLTENNGSLEFKRVLTQFSPVSTEIVALPRGKLYGTSTSDFSLD